MKIVVLNARDRFRKEDLEALDKQGAVFYEGKATKLESVKELRRDEEVVLGIQPSYIYGSWKGLPIEKLKKIKKLKGLCLSTTAYGWAPFEELGEMGIPVANVPGKSTDAVSEYYIFMMVVLLRKLPGIIKNNWAFSYGPDVMGTDAKGLNAGIVGLGQIGRKIADLCHAYDMNVSYWSRSKKDSPYEHRTLEELLKTSDVVFITIVADNSTKGMVTNKLIDSMKKTALILSPVDHIVYDKDYILKKVSNNELGGFGFETDDEKITDFKGNVFPAPEVGYYTKQTLDNESRIMTESMLGIAKGKPVNIVNL